MSDMLNPNVVKVLSIHDEKHQDLICKVSRALSIPERMQILQSISAHPKSVAELSQELNIPASSVARHIEVLADAQLIYIMYQPGPKGHVKYCVKATVGYTISLDQPVVKNTGLQERTVEMPVGLFSHCHVKAPCGMLSNTGELMQFDDPSIFFMPQRTEAECLWFGEGFISYNFPALQTNFNPTEISFSLELCSETAFFNENWPSDITIYINKVEICTFTSPGDFGGRKGKYTPDFWPIVSTQYGLLKTFSANKKGIFIDNIIVTPNVTIDDLHIDDGSAIQFTIEIKKDAVHKGGINLFGKHFGDYPQAIIMKISGN